MVVMVIHTYFCSLYVNFSLLLENNECMSTMSMKHSLISQLVTKVLCQSLVYSVLIQICMCVIIRLLTWHWFWNIATCKNIEFQTLSHFYLLDGRYLLEEEEAKYEDCHKTYFKHCYPTA
jgi:hypothetical protein